MFQPVEEQNRALNPDNIILYQFDPPTDINEISALINSDTFEFNTDFQIGRHERTAFYIHYLGIIRNIFESDFTFRPKLSCDEEELILIQNVRLSILDSLIEILQTDRAIQSSKKINFLEEVIEVCIEKEYKIINCVSEINERFDYDLPISRENAHRLWSINQEIRIEILDTVEFLFTTINCIQKKIVQQRYDANKYQFFTNILIKNFIFPIQMIFNRRAKIITRIDDLRLKPKEEVITVEKKKQENVMPELHPHSFVARVARDWPAPKRKVHRKSKYYDES